MNRPLLACLAATLAIALSLREAPADTFDVDNDYSFTNNPNGVWTFGAINAAKQIDSFQTFTEFATGDRDAWRLAGIEFPSVGRFGITTFDTVTLVPEDTASRERATVRFTAPYGAIFTFVGLFNAQDEFGEGTDSDYAIQTSLGSTLQSGIIDALPDGNGNETAAINFQKLMSEGESIYFSVGNGPDNFFNDGTGLKLAVTATEPCPFGPGVSPINPASLPYIAALDTTANADNIVPTLSFAGATDAFWTFTPPTDGTYSFALLSKFSPVFMIARGTCCDPIAESTVAHSNGIGTQLARTLVGGQNYFIAVDGVRSRDFGPGTLRVDGPLAASANGVCAGAIAIGTSALPFEGVSITNLNANNSTLPTLASNGGEGWWKFTPAQTGRYEIAGDILGKNSALGLFTGPCGTLVNTLALNDEAGGEQVVRTLTAGTEYSIVVDGMAGSTGYTRLRLRGPGVAAANATCAAAAVINPASLPFNFAIDTTFNGSTFDTQAAIDDGGSSGPDSWFRFTPTVTASYILSALGDATSVSTNNNLALGIYTGACGSLATVFEASTKTEGEFLIAPLTAGTQYTLLVEGVKEYDFGQVRVFFDRATLAGPNDTAATAIVIPPASLPLTTTVDNTGNASTLIARPAAVDAEKGNMEPAPPPVAEGAPDPDGGPDVWFSFIPNVTGTYTFTVRGDYRHDFSNLEEHVRVFSGPVASLAEIASGIPGGSGVGLVARARALLTAGQTYRILVEGARDEDIGPLTLTASGPSAPSFNDLCEGEDNKADDSWRLFK